MYIYLHNHLSDLPSHLIFFFYKLKLSQDMHQTSNTVLKDEANEQRLQLRQNFRQKYGNMPQLPSTKILPKQHGCPLWQHYCRKNSLFALLPKLQKSELLFQIRHIWLKTVIVSLVLIVISHNCLCTTIMSRQVLLHLDLQFTGSHGQPWCKITWIGQAMLEINAKAAWKRLS